MFSMLDEIELLMERAMSIRFHADMVPADLRRIRAELSDLYAEARRLYMQARRTADRYDMALRNAQKTIILNIDKESGDGKKLTEKEREALAIKLLETQPLEGFDRPLPELAREAEEVRLAAEALLDIIRDKQEALVTFLAALKLEAGIDHTIPVI